VVNDVAKTLVVSRRDPQTRLWQIEQVPIELALGGINKLQFSPDGKTFVSFVSGAMIYDGKNWQTFSTENGLIDDYVRSIAQGPDGSYVFVTKEYLSRYNPETQKMGPVIAGA